VVLVCESPQYVRLAGCPSGSMLAVYTSGAPSRRLVHAIREPSRENLG